MTLYSSISYIKPTTNGALLIDPVNGKQKLINSLEEIHFRSFNEIEKEWIEKGWLHSLRYIASKKSQVSKINGVFHDVDSLIKGDFNSLASSLLKRRTVRKFKKTKVNNLQFQAIKELMAKISTAFPGFSFEVFEFAVESEPEILTSIWNGKIETKKEISSVLTRPLVSKCIAGMPASLSAVATIFLVCDFKTLVESNSEFAKITKIFVEAGQIFQAILQEITLMNLVGVPSPAVSDIEAKLLLELNTSYQWPIYSLAVGLEG